MLKILIQTASIPVAMGSGKSIGHGFSSWVYGAQNFGATVIGALNSNESQSAGSGMSGIANSIVGVANKVNSSNGTLVFC